MVVREESISQSGPPGTSTTLRTTSTAGTTGTTGATSAASTARTAVLQGRFKLPCSSPEQWTVDLGGPGTPAPRGTPGQPYETVRRGALDRPIFTDLFGLSWETPAFNLKRPEDTSRPGTENTSYTSPHCLIFLGKSPGNRQEITPFFRFFRLSWKVPSNGCQRAGVHSY